MFTMLTITPANTFNAALTAQYKNQQAIKENDRTTKIYLAQLQESNKRITGLTTPGPSIYPIVDKMRKEGVFQTPIVKEKALVVKTAPPAPQTKNSQSDFWDKATIIGKQVATQALAEQAADLSHRACNSLFTQFGKYMSNKPEDIEAWRIGGSAYSCHVVAPPLAKIAVYLGVAAAFPPKQ